MQNEQKHFFNSFVNPVIFVLFLWLIKLTEYVFDTNFIGFGLKPQSIDGLQGILFSPLIHADADHLFSNTLPLLVLGFGLFYFYREISFKVLAVCYLGTGILVWIFARGNSYHIGASGVVYALASFHMLSTILRWNKRLVAYTLVVIFLFGGMVWGIFPELFPEKNISWESHFFGGIIGMISAYLFKNQGIQKEVHEWDDEDDDDEHEYWVSNNTL